MVKSAVTTFCLEDDDMFIITVLCDTLEHKYVFLLSAQRHQVKRRTHAKSIHPKINFTTGIYSLYFHIAG